MTLSLMVYCLLPTLIMAQGAGDLCTVPVRILALGFFTYT